MKIDSLVLQILAQCETQGNLIFLPKRKLDRNLYVAVNKVLEALGGRWDRKEGGHIFPVDTDGMLEDVINTGTYTDAKKEYQFFETPVELAKHMVDLAEIKPGDRLLEPSAGKGRILDQFPPENFYLAIELNDDCYKYLTENYSGRVILHDDFLKVQSPGSFDKIVMNPPFSNGQDVKHVMHAWNNFLDSGGTLVAIMSESPFFRVNKLSTEFRQWLRENDARMECLEPGTFKGSGTNVRTRLIVVKKR